MPLDTHFSIIINQFDNTQSDVRIDYEEVFEEEKIMLFNTIIYMYADRLILVKDLDNELIKKIRRKCGTEINREFQSLEFSYNQLIQLIKEFQK